MPNPNEARWINEIDLKYNGENNDFKYVIGSTFDNIFYNITSTFSLKDFFDKIEKFFNKQMHMIYQANEPENQKIMEWYQVIVDVDENNQTEDEKIAANNYYKNAN